MYLAFKNLKKRVKKVNNGQKTKSNVPINFFDVTETEDKARSCNYKLNCKKQVKETKNNEGAA